METLGLSMARQPGAAVEVWVGGAGVLGQFTFADELRPEANVLVAALHAEKIQSVMLTGDRSDAAAAMARQAGVLDVRAGLSPEGKVEAIQELKRGGGKVAMIGDGVNDAPVLAAADVGVAMGAHGSDAALEQAEVVLMNDRLENFLVAMRISRGAAGIIHQNMVIALGTVVVMVLASILHAIPLAWGVAAHEGSTVLVVMNSLRLLFIRRH
jgi:Cd2+/Zn2+-exporting ATPase